MTAPPKSEDRAPRPQAGPGADEVVVPAESYGQAVSSVLMAISPWALSIAVHVGIILLAVFAAWQVVPSKGELEAQQAVIPVTSLPGPRPPGSLSLGTKLGIPGLKSVPKDQPPMLTTLNAKNALGGAEGPGVGPHAGMGGIGRGKAGDGVLDLIGFGSGGGGNPTGNPFGKGVAGHGEGLFRMPGPVGLGGGTQTVAYVIDASGSLIDTLPFVLNELRTAINSLGEGQSFTVIFFHDNKILESPPAGLKRASAANRRKLAEWLEPARGNVVPGGATTPIDAVKLALRYRPNTIYLLSDNITGSGRFEWSQQELVVAIQQANAGTKINTIQFIHPDGLERYGMQPTLKLIAEHSGGKYRFVTREELGIE